jgi:hypothetical protein
VETPQLAERQDSCFQGFRCSERPVDRLHTATLTRPTDDFGTAYAGYPQAAAAVRIDPLNPACGV